MDRRTAKREACWLAATLILSTIGVGWDLLDGHGYTEAEVTQVEKGLAELIAELERRGGK